MESLVAAGVGGVGAAAVAAIGGVVAAVTLAGRLGAPPSRSGPNAPPAYGLIGGELATFLSTLRP
ncbi:hypothetical protein ABZP36_011405 [Zizania latifolia]